MQKRVIRVILATWESINNDLSKRSKKLAAERKKEMAKYDGARKQVMALLGDMGQTMKTIDKYQNDMKALLKEMEKQAKTKGISPKNVTEYQNLVNMYGREVQSGQLLNNIAKAKQSL